MLVQPVVVYVSLKSSVYRDILVTPRSPLKFQRRFGGTFSLHLHCRISQAIKQHCYLFHTGFLLGLFFDPEDGTTTLRYIPECYLLQT
jgi:hypothetical protein